MAIGYYHLVMVGMIFATIVNPIWCQDFKCLFVFGDSLFDAGNNQYIKNTSHGPGTYWPYGMNNQNTSTGRLSDGFIVPDFIALRADLDPEPPFLAPGSTAILHGANFASAGSGVLEAQNGAMNLKMQLKNFKTVVALLGQQYNGPKEILMSSVFLISHGGNDYFTFNTNSPNATEDEMKKYVNMVLGNLTNGLEEMYKLGMRKIAFQNVGPLGCYPLIKAMHPETNGSCVESFLKAAQMHNKLLPDSLKQLQTKLPGFKYTIFDYYTALYDRMMNPTKYGFEVGDTACCGRGPYNAKDCGGTEKYNLCKDPNKYVLFDGGHHTEMTNEQLAAILWEDQPKNSTVPYSMEQLFKLP